MYQAGFSGQIHLYVKDLATGVRYTHNAATPTYIASVVKILFLVELFDQVERGELNLLRVLLLHHNIFCQPDKEAQQIVWQESG